MTEKTKDNDVEYDLPISPYNYCDYRCEKCDAVDRCLVYQKETEAQEQGKDAIEVLSDSLKETMSMVKEFIKEKDIDISDIIDDEKNLHRQIHNMVKELPVMKLGRKYMDKSMAFLEHYRERYLVPPMLDEAFSDLSWYHALLPVKMHRALDSLYNFIHEKHDYGKFALEDAFFTSLVVNKALAKSLAAVETLREALTDYRQTLTELEDILINIRREFKHEFPFEILMNLLNQENKSNLSKISS
jgi:hypothetical protein